jgi:hypothetical protein
MKPNRNLELHMVPPYAITNIIAYDFYGFNMFFESPSLFRVQFVSKLSGNGGQYGRSGRFFHILVDFMDTLDAKIRCGQVYA